MIPISDPTLLSLPSNTVESELPPWFMKTFSTLLVLTFGGFLATAAAEDTALFDLAAIRDPASIQSAGTAP